MRALIRIGGEAVIFSRNHRFVREAYGLAAKTSRNPAIEPVEIGEVMHFAALVRLGRKIGDVNGNLGA